jgi:hypothetical protein
LRRRTHRQKRLPFLERRLRLERSFKSTIAGLTLLVLLVLALAFPRVRHGLAWKALEARWAARRLVGQGTSETEVAEAWQSRREQAVVQTRANAAAALARTRAPAFRRLLDLAGMTPETAVVRWGLLDHAFLLSSRVFEADDTGRSYRLRPNVRAVWIKQHVLPKPDTGLILVPDTPEIRSAASQAGVPVLEGTEQTTNSWGCRGPEPDLDAPLRGLVLGDSFMLGMLVDDQHTPPMCLERALQAEVGTRVSLLNTGVLGYAPEQYLATLRQFVDRFRPHFVLVSVFANDFGDEEQPDWDGARSWLARIREECEARNIPYLLTPIVGHQQLAGLRQNTGYPARVVDIAQIATERYLDPTEDFLNEHLRLMAAGPPPGQESPNWSPLYNLHLGDGHYNARGTELWGRLLARRLAVLMRSSSSTSRHIPSPSPR